MEYRVVNTITYKGLVQEVNNLIKDGWIPQGGVNLAEGKCHQAMIRTK
jgi:hypothetical protein